MLLIGERPLTLQDVWKVAVEREEVGLSDTAREQINVSRARVDAILNDNKVVYGINTGFGEFSRVTISREQLKTLQRNLIISHAVGVGDNLPADVVRAIMLLRVNNIALGYSGATLHAVETLCAMINKGVHPCVPEKGSVGASGDLAPLAHVVLTMMGEGKAECNGEVMSSADAMKKAGISVHELDAKEGLALINGTQVMTAIGCLALYKAMRLSKIADITGATTLEALKGTDRAFDERVHLLRPHMGQINAASNLRKLLAGSEILPSHRNCSEVQDAYSLRCMPQVHGATKDALRYVKNVLETEINSVTDNPLIFEGEGISGGNFHGQPVAIAMDFMKVAVAELGNISERRTERLVNPNYSNNLPAFLIEEGGVNSGWMIPQYVAAALVSENKVLAHPASVDSIPTSAGKEDHVSMGTIAARQCAQIVDNVYHVLAIELIAAVQGVEFRRPFKAGSAVEKACELVRTKASHIDKDRWFKIDIDAVYGLLQENAFTEAVEAVAGTLEV